MTELWIPGAIRKPIPAGDNDPQITPIGNIFHVAVSEAASLHDFFAGRSGGIESHGYIRRDGTIEQYRDAHHEADANYLANSFVRDGRRYGFLSWETQGMGPGEWTPQQLESIKRIIRWTHAEHGIPLRVAPGWDQPGQGYHILFPEWSNVRGKTCPGPDRIKQFHTIIAPWLETGATPEEDDMQLDDKLFPKQDDSRTVGQVLARMDRFIDSQHARTKALLARVAALRAAVDDNADRDEIKQIVSGIEAEINLVINEPQE